MNKKWLPILICTLVVFALVLCQFVAPASAAEEIVPFVTDSTTTAEDVLTAWNSGSYSYVKLGADLELALTEGKIVVDLAGKNLTVSGAGEVKAFDSANDTYDHTLCGTLTVNDDVVYSGDYVAPNGNRYIAHTDGNRSTIHRLDMKITSVSLRMSTAGVYYKAVFACDRFMQEKVDSYGVAVSTKKMPDANFDAAEDVLYTVNDADAFVNGATVNSGIINNILDIASDKNASNLKTKIYARVYINFGGNTVLDITGVSASLMNIMTALDGVYAKQDIIAQSQLDDFYRKWSNENVNWSFTSIGQKAELNLDNINAELNVDSNNQAFCYVCGKTATWTAVSDGKTRVATVNGGHYYLTDDITYDGDKIFIGAPGEGGEKACFHLNGHSITATAAKAIGGDSGLLNIMGNGTVAGYCTKTDEGAVYYSNNKNKNNGLNLYGGTYKRADNVKSAVPVIGFGGNGRAINIYDGVIVDGGTGTAISFGGAASREKQGYFNFYGCTINGAVKIGDFDTYVTNVKFINTTINGTLTIPKGQNIVLSGNVNITNLVVPEGLTFTTKGLEEGSNIVVDATGAFIEPTGSAASYVNYFVPKDTHNKIFAKNNTLSCRRDYTSDLAFEEGTTNAYCPVCDKTVAWFALTQENLGDAPIPVGEDGKEEDSVVNLGTLDSSKHYYLAESITAAQAASVAVIRGPGSANGTACLHLNGNDLTTTGTKAIFGGTGVLNIMGSGVVSGKGKSGYGATLQNNGTNNDAYINLYAGTYQQTENAADGQYTINANQAGGHFNIYEDATVKGNSKGNAIRVGSATSTNISVNVYGTTIEGNIYMVGASSNYSTALTLDNAVVTGTVNADGINTIQLFNKVKIGLLDIEEDTSVILESLMSGSNITVKNSGVFAYPSSDTASVDEAESYVAYFKTEWINDKIVFKDDALVYKTNYEMRLQLDGESKAWCPVCMEYAIWTELTLDETTGRGAMKGGHHYLASDIVSDYAGTSSAPGLLNTSTTGNLNCLHLNGHNVVANNAIAIYGSQDGLNIMGSGSIKGYGHGSKAGAVAHINNKNAEYGIRFYSGTFESLYNKRGVLSLGNGGAYWVYEDAVIGKVGNTGLAIDTGSASGNEAALYIYDATINGNVNIPGASSTFTSTIVANNTEIKGTVTIAGTNDIVFSGVTKISKLVVAEDSLVGFDNLLGGSAIKVDANGIFTNANDKSDTWLGFFTAANSDDWVIVRDKALFQGERVEVTTAEDADIEKLLEEYGDRVAKYGEMHNHTSAGLTADGRRTLAQWKERMVQLGMDFATIVDHKQVAHMYHKDWQTEPTEESPVVFVGGSEPGTNISEMIAGTQGNMHYNMITADPVKLIDLVKQMEEITDKDFYTYEKPYSEANWGANGTNNKNKDFVWSDYNEPDGKLDRFSYPKWTRSEFQTMVELFYNEGSLIVEVHPDYPSYIKSSDPMDYCFAGNAGSTESAAMGFEIHTGGYGRKPSDTYNEQAYQLWLDMLDAGKKVYATYGDDGHRMPTAVALTTAYAPEGANADYYMQLMHDGNFAPGWVGIRMIVGDTQMGGTADSFEGQRLVFSIGDMFQANEYSRLYLDKSLKQQTMDWEPGYDPSCIYTVRLYDDSGLLQESVVDPGDDKMDYFAIDAEADAKFYRVEVWVEKQNEDGSTAYRYRCGVGNPIWNAAAYATAE